jgi:uncharacterized protein (TIGR02391 family)
MMIVPHNRYRALAQKAPASPLSELLPDLLLLAQELHNDAMSKWAALELGGYFAGNSALTPDVKVPPYRIIVGQYSDQYGRPLVITDSRMAFVNEYPMRESVAELEKYAGLSGIISVQDPKYIEMLREKLNIHVTQFSFDPSCITGVLGGIRTRLIQWLAEAHGALPPEQSARTTVVSDSGRQRRRLAEIFGCDKDSLNPLHSSVRNVAQRLFRDGHYRQAVLDTYIALVQRVKDLSGRHDLDNTALVQAVFSPKNPILVLSDNGDEQMGFMWMFSGAVMGIRNPNAHRLSEKIDKQQAFEWLAFASVLFRLLDSVRVKNPPP